MSPANSKKYRADRQSNRALTEISRRFKIRLRLAREMQSDGYLRIVASIPNYIVQDGTYTENSKAIYIISHYYGISSNKIVNLYNKGYITLDGLDYKKSISRYLQQHEGRLSVRLLCYLAYDGVRRDGSVVTDRNAHGVLSALKIDGKLRPPRDLEPYLGDAIKGEAKSLERVARWMRDLIESVATPHGWAFFGVRLALAEGSYDLWERTVPKLRKLRNHRQLARRLREHPLLQECATPVARSRRNSDYSYIYHRPGTFWDL